MFESLIGTNRTAKRVYLDYAGATPVLPEAIKAFVEASRRFGNPGAIHADGIAAQTLLQSSRERIARLLGCKSGEIVFTSGGTESNNLAILGFARQQALVRSGGEVEPRDSTSLRGTHWIVSAIEHPSVLAAFGEVERLGGTVSFAEPDARGIIAPETIARLLREETVFVSIGWGNGEIGAVQPLSKIARVIQKHEAKHDSLVIFHSDAGQAPLYDAAHPRSLGIDLLSLDSGKLYGPRGVGALYLSERSALSGITFGGAQERGLRAGTENVALGAGFAAAFETIASERAREAKRLRNLRDDFAHELVARIPGAILNTDPDRSLPHILNVSIPGIQSEYVVLALDHQGLSLSTKSACREGEARESHVVRALGDAKDADGSVVLAADERASRTLRFSLGKETAARDLKRAAAALQGVCSLARTL